MIDLVRADPLGLTLVSGKAEGAERVAILADGAVVAEEPVLADGRFAMFVDLVLDRDPVILTLRAVRDGETVDSDGEVIVTPPAPALARAAPVATGTAQPGQDADASSSESAPAVTAETGVSDAARPGVSVVGTAPASAAAPQPGTAATVDSTTAAPGLARDATPLAVDSTPPTQPTAPAVLLSNAAGIEVLQAAPLPPSGVALDAITYDAEGDVFLAGRGAQSGFLRIYLDNAPVTTSRIREDGRWRVALPEIDTGTYTLRVDQLDAAGAVIARVESPFLREEPAILAAARDADAPVSAVTVQPGNTLWAIARSRYGEGTAYVRVFEANADQIRDPDLIYPGQVFSLPD
ncbi:LysM peptidoglycan-binding domain-containing protein [Thalassococcus sp. CAU 1522]|uniref:LysM peptidoglycan-binding domain-containing protein n=2 Tax=Thalassococcus arenae TaxID=2851652 RepID=A0ABS6NBL5_9RHOB|nr:LysM peptidoglycan-binding domain-containing protein [Thalassococcus arenae]